MPKPNAATRAYIAMLEKIAAAGVERNISLKLTQLGLTIDRATSVDNLRRILDAAAAQDFFVRIDMENSPYTAVTLDVFETMWQQGYRNAGVVLQSYLPRSEADAARMNALGARVRLVKGAYNEPRDAAYQAKADVDAAFVRIMQMLLAGGTLSRDRDPRSRDDRGDAGVRVVARDRSVEIRVPDALRHPPRPSEVVETTGLRHARLCSIRS